VPIEASTVTSAGRRGPVASGGRATAELDVASHPTQGPGWFRPGAIIAQADESAPGGAGEMANPAAEFRPEWHPLDLHMSAHVIRKANRDARVAGAEVVHRRRPMPFAAPRLAPAPPAMTTPTDDHGR
jgi:hypothetical protein